MNCNFCGKDVKPNCDWQQGRCPHRSVIIDEVLLDNYKARYYNLINSINNLFKGISAKWQQKNKNKN
jgi:hypothetical protein